MTGSRLALSLFLICHLTSISLASLPPAVRPGSVGAARHPTDDPIAEVLTPVVDRGARVVAGLTAALQSKIRPILRLTTLYVGTMGLFQTWSMFSQPWTENRHARLRYYVASSHSLRGQRHAPTWMATEIVFPALRLGDRIHFLRAYRAFAWDKAFISSITAAVREPSKTEIDLALSPVVRYFTNRYQREHLVAGERIVRTEVWLGKSPVRPRGSSDHPQSHDARAITLTESYAGSVEKVVVLGAYLPINAIEMQEDIVWKLEYFDEYFE